MADEDQDESQKTEDPTQKRLDDALKKGQVPNSREVSSFLMLVVFTLALIWMSPSIMKKSSLNLSQYIESPHSINVDSSSVQTIAIDILSKTLFVMIPPFILLIMAIYLSGFLQHPLVLSGESMQPKLERISILKGIKRLFSARTLIEFLKGLFKIFMVGTIGFLVIAPEIDLLKDLHSQGAIAILILASKLALKLLIGVCVFMGLVAVVDFIYQKHEHTKSLRMSKRDLKDEYKQSEGSPEVKAKLRELRQQRANQRMMSQVPNADVVVTNPTHYSVALQYDEEKTEAPVVVAKGMDLIALKIREVAKENEVPLVENPPLARALYSSVELEQEIPLEHYNAVAEVIRYVYQLKGKKNKKRKKQKQTTL